MKTMPILCLLLSALAACSSPSDAIHSPASVPVTTARPTGPESASLTAPRAVKPRLAPIILNRPRAGTPTCINDWRIDPKTSELVISSCDKRLYRWTLGAVPRYVGHVDMGMNLENLDLSDDGIGVIGVLRDESFQRLQGWRLGAERTTWATLREHDTNGWTTGIESAAISPDGKLVASTGSDAVLRLWNAATGEPVATYPDVKGQVAFAADGGWLAASGGVMDRGRGDVTSYAARLIDLRTRKTHTLPLRGRERMAVSPDGGRMALAKNYYGNDDYWYVLDTKTRRSVKRARMKFLRHMEYSADGSLFLALWGSSDRIVSLYDAATMKRLGDIKADDCGIGMAHFTPDSKRVVTVSAAERKSRCAGRFEVFDASNSARLARFNPLRVQRAVSALAFSNNGRYLATGSSGEGLAIWDVTTRARIATIDRPDLTIASIQFSADDRQIVYSRGGGKVDTYDLTTGALDSYYVGGGRRQLRDAAWGRDRQYIWGCDAEGVYRREAAPARDRAHLAELLRRLDWECESVRFLDQDRSALLITPGLDGRDYVILDVDKMEWRAPKKRSDKSPIRFLTVSPSRTYRVRRIESGTVEIIDKDDEPVTQLVTATSAGATVEPHFWFSADERILFGRVDDRVFRWDAPFERAQPRRVAGLSGDSVLSISPDGNALAVGLIDGRIELHSFAAGR